MADERTVSWAPAQTIVANLRRMEAECGDAPSEEGRRKWLDQAMELKADLTACTADDFVVLLETVAIGARSMCIPDSNPQADALLAYLATEQHKKHKASV